MNFESLRPLADHLWQSTLFAVLAALLALALRNNRARVRHGVWLAASCKFLIPLSILIGLGAHFPPRASAPLAQSGVFAAASHISRPFAGPAVPATSRDLSATAPRDLLPALLFFVWVCGFFGIACSWLVRWRRIRALVRAGSLIDLGLPIPAVASPAFPEPGIFGIVRPSLLLPAGILAHLSPAKFEAVIAHELCHVRHRDNLAAAFQMSVETLFWFHPVVWWIGKRMVAERERACDDEVLRLGSEPNVYAESILEVCALSVEAPHRFVSGAGGADLKKRVRAIVARRVEADLSPARKTLLAVIGTACVALPVLIGIGSAPPEAAAQQPDQASASAPLLPPSGIGFHTFSVERCGTYISGEIESPEPGTLVANCLTAASLISTAYTKSAFNSTDAAQRIPLSWEPVWVGSGNYLYRIEARADRRTSLATMEGPMLQALLAERFGLKIRRVTRKSPMYALRAAQGGAKMRPVAEEGCSGGAVLGPNLHAPPPGHVNCFASPVADPIQYMSLDGQAIGLKDFCRLLAGPLRRPVIDETGIAGRFDFHLKFAADNTPAALSRLYPALPEVLEGQLGLKLEPFTGARDFLVIDRIGQPLPE